MGFYFNSDFRLHINLSHYAWSVVNEDMLNFYGEESPNISGFINDIIRLYYQSANASIQLRCDQISSELEEMLTNKMIDINIDGSILYTVIDVATKSFVQKTMEEIKKYVNGSYRKIKLRSAIAEYLMTDCHEDRYYDGNIGDYIKALIEEYTRLPFVKRESIHCRDNLELINRSILNKKQLKITVRSGKHYEAIPFKVEVDKMGMFNYLTGIDIQTRKPVSYRISKVKMAISSKNGSLSRQDEELITRKLAETDVSFLTNDIARVVIALDEYGIKKYNNQLHLRPNYTEIDNNGRYIFHCSVDQIKYYFIKFGSSAKIEEPFELAEYFRRFYTYALRNYQASNSGQQSPLERTT